jgi:hypothetical protein
MGAVKNFELLLLHGLRDIIDKVKYTHQTAALSCVPLMHPNQTLDHVALLLRLRVFVYVYSIYIFMKKSCCGMIIR